MEMKSSRIAVLFCAWLVGFWAQAAWAERMRPLRVSENGRFLVTDGGEPFFMLADTAWALFSGISREDVQFYLDQRKSQGFNTILCSMLYFQPSVESGWAPRHRVYGWWAFDGDHYDLSRPNKEYWDHVDWVIGQARARSLRLAIVPCWFRDQGRVWEKGLTAEAAARFGEYLGLRCCRYNNILWLLGGEHRPAQRLREVRLMAEAISYYAPQQLISYQPTQGASSGELSHGERWLAFNSIQSGGSEYRGEHELVRRDWHRVPAKPTWLAEPHYEDGGSRLTVRRSAWQSVLNGGAGLGYGVKSVFALGYSGGWKELLGMPGGADVVRMAALLESQPWHKLVPDHAARDKLLVAAGAGQHHFCAACSSEGDLGIIYLPVRASLEVDMGKFKVPVVGRWVSPASMESVVVEGSPFINSGVRMLEPPEAGEPNEPDLVLVLTPAGAGEVEAVEMVRVEAKKD